MLPPPPLSLSAPELNIAPPPEPILRPAVSSTELLYERAMARFYQAVALEESVNVRKRSFSVEADRARRLSIGVDQSNHLEPPLVPRLRKNSLSDTDRRSNLRRRLSGEYGPPVMKNVLFKQNSKETEEHSDVEARPQLIRETEPIATISEELFEKTPSPPPKSREENISDDYTDSTASSIESMNQKFIETEKRHARFMDDHEEMDTYHPPRVTLSPPPNYSATDANQAAEILTKKYPLPDPNFVPKPILKRPSKDEKLISKSERNGLLHLFDRNKTSKSQTPSPTPSDIEPPRIETPELPQNVEPVKKEEVNQAIITPVVIIPKKVDNKNKIISREHSLEENHAMADFYAGIVQEVAVKKIIKRKVPLYLNPEEMKKAEEKLEMEESTENLQRNSPINMYRPSNNQSKSTAESVSVKKEQLNVIEPPKIVTPKEKSKEPRVVTEEEFLARLKSKTNPTANPQSVTAKPIPQPAKEEIPIETETPERGRPTGAVARRPGQSTSRTRSQSGVRTRNGSVVRTKPQAETAPDAPPRPARTVSKTRNRSESKSPSAMKRRQLQPSAAQPRAFAPRMQATERVVLDADLRPTTPEELKEATDIKVKSTISYATDFSLFILACYLYIFKDARLAIPILFLMVYRQIGEAVKDKIPSWMKGKKS
jgi:titin